MKKNIIASAIAIALAIPVSADAAKVLGDALEIYGKLHVSVDASDNDRAGANAQKDVSASSNSTRLGFKGKHKIGNGDLAIVYKMEQEVDVSSSGGNFATRNAYAGIKSSFGQIILGHHDTPFKIVGSKWGMFGDSVGERRAILGASATKGNKMNQRGKNALMWSKKFGDFKAMAMYATDAQDSAAGAIDKNDNDMKSVAVLYKNKNLYLGAAYEDWSNLAVSGTGQTDGYRIMGGYKFGMAQVGLIYESISSAASKDIERDVWGINGKVKIGSGMDIRAQYLTADDYAGVANSGATKVSLGLFKKLDKQTQIYAVYAATDNDANAQYQAVDGGHGDEIKTDLGGNPNSFSVGLVYKF